MRVASFDIGKLNFAFYIEDFDEESLKKMSPVNKKSQEFILLLDKIYKNGELILHKNLNLTYGAKKGRILDPVIYHNMVTELDKYKEIFDKCDVVLIEQQMNFGKVKNNMAIKLAQHCYSYFIMRYPIIKLGNILFNGSKEIIDYPAYHKTQVLNAPKGMIKSERKKWAVERVQEIFTSLGKLNYFDDVKKKDDLADTYLQLQSFKYLRYVEGVM